MLLVVNNLKVKFPGKFTLIFLVVIAGIFTQFSFNRADSLPSIEDHFMKRVNEVKKLVAGFQESSKKKLPLNVLKTHFSSCRLSYKKLAVLSEYFNAYETIMLNSPALNRLATESPDDIIAPDGFQAVEQLLYSDWTKTSYKKLDTLLTGIQQAFTIMENEPDRKYKFKSELVWDALRSSTLRIIALGITGFDSPVAQLSFRESIATLEGIKEILLLLKKNGVLRKDYNQLFILLSGASDYIKKNPDFDKFDRLSFITRFADPFYKQLNLVRNKNNIPVPDGANPINFTSISIFDKNAFNINFFSPSKMYWMTQERVELGKKLFYDNILSGSKTRSCASCHKPEKAFTDGLKTPLSINDKTSLSRNSPTLINCAFQTKFFYDNRVALLEGQLTAVIHNTEEMQGSLDQSVIDLQNTAPYPDLFRKAYPDETESLTTYTIINAVSSYVRSLTSLNSRFDLYMRGDKQKMTTHEKNGFNLFMGKAKCATCHFIPLFNGLVPPVFNETESEVLGVPSDTSKTNAKLDEDSGRYGFTKSSIHKYAFKTSTLRNISLTAPYMHNGVYTTLEEVMEFYNNGGGKGLKIAPENQTLPFDKLNLSPKEIKDIISFMKSLTDTTYSSAFIK